MASLLQSYITKYVCEGPCDDGGEEALAIMKKLMMDYYELYSDECFIEKNIDILLLLLNQHAFKTIIVLTVIRLKELDKKEPHRSEDIELEYIRTQNTMTKMDTLQYFKKKHEQFIPLFVISLYGFL
jgi:hypothetical protein